MTATSGIPDNQFGVDGSLAIDQDTGTPYVKYNGSWASLADVLGAISSSNANGSGTPEGTVISPVGAFYMDTSTDSLWYKKTGTGNTGWVQLL